MSPDLIQSAELAQGPGASIGRSDRRMRVLAFIEAYSVTGPAKNLIEFARRAAAFPQNEGAEICFVTFVRGEGTAENAFIREVKNSGLEIRVLTERGAFDPGVPAKIRKTLRDFRPDIIQTHNVKSHFLIWLTREFRHYPWIAFQHGYTWTDLKMRIYNQLDRISLPAANTVVTVCRPFADALEKTGVRRDRIVIRHNSVKPFTVTSRDAVDALRRTLNVADERLVLLTVGRLSMEKGHSDLIQAIALLQARHSTRNVVLIVVGDGPERSNLTTLASTLGIGDRIVFAGQQSDVNPYYSLADIVVLPSHTEGSPNVLLEAMAAGKAIVATIVGGVPEIASDGENAVLVPSRSPEQLCGGIQSLMDSPELRQKLSSAALARSRQYDPECYCSFVLEVYARVAGHRLSAKEGQCASPS